MFPEHSLKGNALFPVMPYLPYGQMDKEDIYSIIAYLRSLPSIKNDVEASSSDFPMNTIPKEVTFSIQPAKADQIAYGKYLFNAASCRDCHTPQEQGTPIKELELAGGFEFPMPSGGIARSSNITPDKKTGIGTWTKEMFINRFKVFTDSSYVLPSVAQNEPNTVMPWTMAWIQLIWRRYMLIYKRLSQ